MVKDIQTIRRQFPNKLSLFDHFLGSALKGLKEQQLKIRFKNTGVNLKYIKRAWSGLLS